MKVHGRSELRVGYVTDTDGFHRLASDWRSLAGRSIRATVFQSYDWNAVWWRHFGEKTSRRLRIVTFHDDAGALIGLAPFYTSFYYATPLKRLSFIGLGASDYLDVIAPEEQREAVLGALDDALLGADGWQIADLQQLREGGIIREMADGPLRAAESIGEPCPYISLPQTWPDFLATLGKKTRSNIGYYERSLHKMFDVRIGWVTEADQLDAEMTSLFNLHQRRWNKRWLPGVFGSPKTQLFHRDVARALLEQGHLRLFRVALDGETQAALYCFSFGDRVSYYQGGFEPTLSRLSLGTILTATAVRTAIEEGKTVFDFLRGDEEYKAKWTSLSKHNTRRIAVRTPLLRPLASGARAVEHVIETRAKKLARRFR